MLKAGGGRNNEPKRSSHREDDRPGNWMREPKRRTRAAKSAETRAMAAERAANQVEKKGKHLRGWRTEKRDVFA
ncbi:MAG: hypothetical protein K0S33_685 [Bacteroidetes bacterium]|jgi:hypothetical protein|nr:hypothetical protein [Bacteroidota bacterium]